MPLPCWLWSPSSVRLMATRNHASHYEFDVASVKPTASADEKSFLRSRSRPASHDENNFLCAGSCCSPTLVQDYQLAGDPPWMGSDHYDIQATAESGTSVQQMEGANAPGTAGRAV